MSASEVVEEQGRPAADARRGGACLSRTLGGVLLAVTATALVLMAVDVTFGLPLPGFLRPIWLWHYEAIEFGAAGVCVLRALGERRERLAWIILALGMTSYAAADLYWDLVLQYLPAIPYPSPADALYLAFYPAAYVALALLLRARGGRFQMTAWLDGAIGAVGMATVVGAVVFPVVLTSTHGATMTVVTNIAYPIADLALLGLVTCVIGAMGWRPGWAWSLLAGGFALFAICDTFYLYETARGTYATNTWLDLGWPAALVLVAVASSGDSRRVRPALFVRWPTLVVPAVFGTSALAIAMYDHFWRVNTFALLLAGATLALVIARLAMTFAEHLDLIAKSHREAFSDPLTGLGNRRALASDLENAIATSQDVRHALVLFDLDGFKSYNDTFGHPAGDALLQRSAGALAAAPHRGSAYRMGGDEFCLLAHLPVGGASSRAEALAELGARALAARGELFDISASYGVVVIPDEAATATDAIRLADQRMYARKGTGRRSPAAAAISALLRAMQERASDLGEHSLDVGDLARELAAAMQLPEAECESVRQAAVLHDVGKLAIPDTILDKPGPLNDAEAAFMRRHTEIGERILGEEPGVAPIGSLVRSSHEAWDGGGYPDRLSGTEIPLGARIIALCDAYHAMTTTRSYRAADSHADAVAELRRCAGTQFDPDLIEPFVQIIERRLARQRPELRAAA